MKQDMGVGCMDIKNDRAWLRDNSPPLSPGAVVESSKDSPGFTLCPEAKSGAGGRQIL